MSKVKFSGCVNGNYVPLAFGPNGETLVSNEDFAIVSEDNDSLIEAMARVIRKGRLGCVRRAEVGCEFCDRSPDSNVFDEAGCVWLARAVLTEQRNFLAEKA